MRVGLAQVNPTVGAIVLGAAERGETRHFRLVPERVEDAVRAGL